MMDLKGGLRAFFWMGVFIFFAVFTPRIVYANGLLIENVSFVNKNTGTHTIDVEFDVSWNNSWRDTGSPSNVANWDAVWVFVKYAAYSGGAWSDWHHASLLDTGYTLAAGAAVSFGATSAVNKGAFLYRSASGYGSNDWNDNRFRWDYGADGVSDTARVKVKVFAIEMVYVPQGAFKLGDADGDQPNCFHEGGALTPLTVLSENALTVADTSGNLYYDADTAGSGDRSGPVPAGFPKGYNAFYLMKYELTQSQYAEFLNTLPADAQAHRHDVGSTFGVYRNGIKKTSASPAYFGTDTNGNAGSVTAATRSLLNESSDGEWIAASLLSWMDAAAYADWAGLRPMTEPEFEKAVRGPLTVYDDEYSWGDAVLETAASALSNAGMINEVPNQGNLNYADVSPDGPFRVGSFADASSSRRNAGASFYGLLDMGGNLSERVVTVGNAQGRAFIASHGDGELNTTAGYEGNATNTDWPGIDGTVNRGVTGAAGLSVRGGAFDSTDLLCRTADRTYGVWALTTRLNQNGGARFARTAP